VGIGTDDVRFFSIWLGRSHSANRFAFAIAEIFSRSIQRIILVPVDEMVSATYGLGIRICFEVAIVLLLASLIDYAVQWFGFENRIRMSDQELRDELRSQNGDPVVSQQRQRMVRQVGQRS
jgi:flagellar biosynthetic protein FlhB